MFYNSSTSTSLYHVSWARWQPPWPHCCWLLWIHVVRSFSWWLKEVAWRGRKICGCHARFCLCQWKGDYGEVPACPLWGYRQSLMYHKFFMDSILRCNLPVLLWFLLQAFQWLVDYDLFLVCRNKAWHITLCMEIFNWCSMCPTSDQRQVTKRTCPLASRALVKNLPG